MIRVQMVRITRGKAGKGESRCGNGRLDGVRRERRKRKMEGEGTRGEEERRK